MKAVYLVDENLSSFVRLLLTDKAAFTIVSLFLSTYERMPQSSKTESELMDSYEEILTAQYDDTAQILKKVGATDEFKGLICEAGIQFSSKRLPEFLPFTGVIDIVYEPGTHVIGFAKIARFVREQAAKLQYQEKLTQEIAEMFVEEGGAQGVLVRTRLQHLCASPEHFVTVTSVALGTLKEAVKQTEAGALIQHAYEYKNDSKVYVSR
jgi:GTP cyclohydrolase I